MNPADSGYEELKNAVLGATQQGSPDSPLGNFPEIAKLYSSSYQLPLSEAATHVQAANTAVTVENQRAAAAAARAAASKAQSEKEQALKDMLDPNKYRVEQRDDGGFGFFAPNGQEVSASDFAKVAGTTPNKILADSQNPIDIAFLEDYNRLQQYVQDRNDAASDPDAATAAAATEEEVKRLYNIDLHKQDINTVIDTFKNNYPTIYGRTTTGVQGTKSLLPNSNYRSNAIAGSSGAGSSISADVNSY